MGRANSSRRQASHRTAVSSPWLPDLEGLLLLGRDGRSCRNLIGVAAAANCIVTPLAGKRGLSPGGFMIERKALELVLLRRRNSSVGIGPAVRCRERFVQHGPEPTVDP